MPNGCRELSLNRVGRALLAGLAELDKPVVTAVNCTDNRLAREAGAEVEVVCVLLL